MQKSWIIFLSVIKNCIGNGPDKVEEQSATEEKSLTCKEIQLSAEEKATIEALAKQRGLFPSLPGKAYLNADRFYALMYGGLNVLNILENNGIEAAIVKGVSLAALYPLPEQRLFSDVDVLLRYERDLKKAVEVLTENGWTCSDEKQPHHLSFTCNGITAELHFKPVRPFEKRSINKAIEYAFNSDDTIFIEEELFGVKYKTLKPSIFGFYILIHNLEHFLLRGMGVKHLCDMAVFWNKQYNEEVYKEYKALVRMAGLDKFSDCMTLCTQEYLGLSNENSEKMLVDCRGVLTQALLENIMIDIIDAGNFGELEKDRLVSLRSDGIGGMVSQIHCRMKENFPRLSKFFLIWPILWLATVMIFIRNNKKIRGEKSSSIIKKAQSRGRLVRMLDI